jgi:hypothetical protein
MNEAGMMQLGPNPNPYTTTDGDDQCSDMLWKQALRY